MPEPERQGSPEAGGLLARVTLLEDLEAIRTLRSLYAFRTDENHRAPTHASAVAAAELFADDAILNLPVGTYVGKAAILDAYENIFPTQTSWSMHYVTDPVITVTGATATGKWYILLYTQPRTTPPSGVFVVNGRYEETYVKTAAGWKFQVVNGIIMAPT